MNIKSYILHSNSWASFQVKLLGLNKKQKGDAFELLTKLYFKINPVYNFYDEVWMLSEVPQKELEYLGLPSHDLGIDLIAKYGKEYHAIQCKYHSNKNQSVTFKEVSTFISLLEGNSKLSQGYICSSSIVTSKNFKKIKTKPINLLMSDTWLSLGENFFNQAKKIISGIKVSFKPFEPRKHQKKALEKAVLYFNTEDKSRGKLIFPCGSGKSLTGFWLTQKLKSKSTIIAVPSLSLVKQTLEVYLREIYAKGKSVKWLCICSDEGIGRNDDVVYYTENIGVPCQTDPDYIEDWLNDNRNEEIIIFTTYQSGRVIADISKKLNFKFDVGIFDEAHKTVGSDKKLFSYLLFEENIFINKRVFMTATERFYIGSNDDIISMDDNDIYGDIFAQMSFKEAIELGLLTDYKIITIDVKKSEISEFIKENNLIQLNDNWKKETEARSLASMLALRKAMKQFNIKNAVSFHSSIEKAVRNKELQEHITKTYNYQPIDTYTVSGKIHSTKRNDIVQEFAKSQRALITNARCLTEGVDVPNIDCIVFADPRKSKVDIVQALGRALRKVKGKNWGYVILPVVYDDKSQEIDNDNFNEIMSIVRALASNDERIVEYFKDKSEKTSSIRKRDKNGLFEVISNYLNEDELSEQLQIKIWNKLAKLNWLPYGEAIKIVHTLKLTSQREWSEYCKNYKDIFDIPTTPARTYKNSGWKSWGDWLGTGYINHADRSYKTFEEARKFVRTLGLKKQQDWQKYCTSGQKPLDIPTAPGYHYKNYLGLANWLGARELPYRNRNYLNYNEAKKIVTKLSLKNGSEWKEYCKKDLLPDNIPKYPQDIYRNKGYISMKDWLGIHSGFNGEYMEFQKARSFVRSLELNFVKDWKAYCKSGNKPINVPASPNTVYKNLGWISWNNWLGTEKFFRKFKSFTLARDFVRNLNLKTGDAWYSYCKSGNKPNDIPNYPYSTYKNKGWKGMEDWLGTKIKDEDKKQYKLF